MIAFVPRTTPPPSPPAIPNCRYQVKIQLDTYKCLTEEEWQIKEEKRLTEERLTTQRLQESVRPIGEFIYSYWWWPLVVIIAFVLLKKLIWFLIDVFI